MDSFPGLAMPPTRARGSWHNASAVTPVTQGQRDEHGGSLAGLAAHRDVAVAHVDEAAHEREPQPGPFRRVVRQAHEGPEDALQILRRDAAALVRYAQLEQLAVGCAA